MFDDMFGFFPCIYCIYFNANFEVFIRENVDHTSSLGPSASFKLISTMFFMVTVTVVCAQLGSRYHVE